MSNGQAYMHINARLSGYRTTIPQFLIFDKIFDDKVLKVKQKTLKSSNIWALKIFPASYLAIYIIKVILFYLVK